MLHTLNLQLSQKVVIKTQTMNLNLNLKIFFDNFDVVQYSISTLIFQQMWMFNNQNQTTMEVFILFTHLKK